MNFEGGVPCGALESLEGFRYRGELVVRVLTNSMPAARCQSLGSHGAHEPHWSIHAESGRTHTFDIIAKGGVPVPRRNRRRQVPKSDRCQATDVILNAICFILVESQSLDLRLGMAGWMDNDVNEDWDSSVD